MHNVLIHDQEIPGNERKNFIFNAFEELEPGNSITIICHYDPSDLCEQVHNSHPTECILEYLKKGPLEWKVRLAKNEKEKPLTLH